jgi:hypothetical protein
MSEERSAGRSERNPPLYLRIGDWNLEDPRSYNHAMGEREAGLSAYDLDDDLRPIVPQEGEWAEEDMLDRLASDLPRHLVTGRLVGEGHDGEPLLDQVRIVGSWIGVQGDAVGGTDA